MSAESYDHLIDCLPQKPPALYVDRVVEHAAMERVAGTVTFGERHRVFDGHLPGEPIVPGVVLAEALAQLAGLALMGGEGAPVSGYLAEVAEARFYRVVRPGEGVRLEATVDTAFGDYARFVVAAFGGDEQAMRGKVTVARRP